MYIDNNLINQIKINPLIDTLKLEDIDDDVYFSKKYSKEYISNSRLGLLKTKGAEAFFKGLKSEYNPSFLVGTALHELYLQPESFVMVDSVYKPTAKAGLMADYLYNSDGDFPTDDDIKAASYKIGYYKDKLTSKKILDFRSKAEPYWRDRFLYEKNNITNKKRIYLDLKSCDIVKNCYNSIKNNKQFENLIHPSYIVDEPIVGNEKTILLDIEIDIPNYEPRIYKLKAKLDNFTINFEENIITVNDLKTTSRLVKDFDPSYFSYQREIGYYSLLLKLCANKFFNLNNPKVNGNFLVVSTIPEYNSLVYPMTPKLFRQGLSEVIYLLKTVALLNITKGYEFQ